MANVFQCDRCGSLYGSDTLTKVLIPAVDVNGSETPQRDMELCNDCVQSLHAFAFNKEVVAPRTVAPLVAK